MNFKKITFLIVFISQFCIAQNVDFDKGIILQKKYFEVVQYETVYDKIIIPVTINGKNFRFLLDTGAPNLVSNEVMQELNFVSTNKINIRDANNLNQSMQSIVIPKIEIGKLIFEEQIALVYDLKNHNLLSCYNIDGFIGSNLLKNSSLKIDKTNQNLIITDQIDLLNIKVKPTKVKLIGSQKAPYIELNFLGKNKEKASDMVLFDTGMDGLYDMSNRAFAIFENQNIFEIKGKSEGLSSIGLFGLGKPSLQRLVLVENAFLNNKSINKLYADTTDDSNSRIGLEFLNYGNVILDFKKKNFYFEANETIILSNKEPKFAPTILDNKLIVGLVWDKKLAEKIKFGDEILSIDTFKINEMKSCEILNLKKYVKNKNFYTLEVKNKEGQISKINIEN
ncbi:retropepsin-like aspartic protease [Flavobacterium sp.]|uniref:retropepsin-like aspartic protease n=1 Tax=Flavobacterium sp. TaxID=239 RepID=UPI0033415F51